MIPFYQKVRFGLFRTRVYSMLMSKGIFGSKQKKLIKLLRQLRKEAGLKQWQLAVRLERTQSEISKIERGEYSLDLLELYEFCEAVGISMQEFIRRFEGLMNETE
jgi:DNA-binding XRE family transcriptional regulator